MSSGDDAALIDTGRAHPARVYDYFLGGKDNYAADRAVGDRAIAAVPTGVKAAWDSRRFLIRAVCFVARQGVTQFLDIGAGLPTSTPALPNVHEAVRQVHPGARVVYVDNDPVVLAHNRALRSDGEDGVETAGGDLRNPRGILTDPGVRGLIDFSRPVGLILNAVLHFIPDAERPYDAVTALRDGIAAGSYVVISHVTTEDTSPEIIREIGDAYSGASAPAVFRDRAAIGRFFAGWTLADPGVVFTGQWRPGDWQAEPSYPRMLGGAGRKA